MADRTITSELVLQLKDDLTKPAGKAADALQGITREEARLIEQSKKIEAATRSLAGLGRLDARLDRTKERLAAEEAAVKRLSEAMGKVDRPTKKMVEALLKAEATVKLTNESLDGQKRKLDKAGEAFEKLAGSPFHDLESAEARLRERIEETTSAIRQQAEVSTQTRETEARNTRRREAMAHSLKETMSTLGMLGGPETLHLTAEAAKAGADVQHTRVEMAKAGMSPEVIAATEKQAYQLSAQVRNVAPAEIMEIAKEARSVLTDPKDLAKVLPQLTKAQSVLSARDPSGEQSQSLGLLVKGAENIGAAKDPDRLNRLIDGAVRAMQVMGKTIDAEQFYAFLKNSRLAGAQLSDRFIMTTGMSTLQEMGGQTAGKAVNEMQSELIGGLEHRNVAVRALKKLHLIDGKDIAYSKTGEVTGVKRGRLHVVHGDEKLAHDPDKWVYEDLLPAMRAQGITKKEDQLAMSRQIFSGSKTAQDLVGKLITQQESYAAHGGMYPTAAGTEGYKQNADDPLAALTGLKTQFESFASALTSPMMKEAGHVLDTIAGGLGTMATGLQAFGKDHPTTAALLGGTALGAGAFAGGKMTYGLFQGLFGRSAELKGSADALKASADVGLKAGELLIQAAERLGAPKAGVPAPAPAPGTTTPVEPGAGAPAEPAAEAAAEPVKPKGVFGEGGLKGALKSVPKGVAAAGPEALLDYYAYKAGTGAIDYGLNALPLKQNSAATKSHLDDRGVSGTVRDLWYHLRGRDTPEEAAAKAAVPIAGARAAGGPVAAGRTYLVGERGPELFTPGMNGAISTAEVQRALARGLATPTARLLIDGGDRRHYGGSAAGAQAIVQAIRALDEHNMRGFIAVAHGLAQLERVSGRPGTGAGGKPGVRLAGARAAGGSVLRGETYLVGERGPELFTAGATGQISTNARLKAALDGGDTPRTVDIQRVLARAIIDDRGITAKSVQQMGVELARSVDGVARAVDRLDRDARIRRALERAGVDVSGAGTGSHISGGRQGFMARGGHFGGRRGFLTHEYGTRSESLPDGAAAGPRVRLGHMGPAGAGRFGKFDAKAPAIMGGLMAKYGLTKEQAAGIVGNLGHESARFTAYHEGGKAPGSGGVGWAQWTGPRRRAFERWTAAHNLEPTSDEASWRFLTEGDPQTAKAIAAVKHTHTAGEATRAFHDSYENSADIRNGQIVKPRSWQDRLDLADRAAAMAPVAGEKVAPADQVASGRSVAKEEPADAAGAGALRDDAGHAVAVPKGESFGGHLRGKLALDGRAYDFGSGGNHNASSIPFGDYEITPDAVGAWGKANGALGIANGQIYDKALGRMRAGIELHAAHSATMISSGCLAFAKDQFGAVKQHVLKMVREKGHAYLHVGAGGASITPERDAPSAPDLNAVYPRNVASRRAHDDQAAGVHAGLAALHGADITPAVDTQHLERTAALLDHIHGRIGAIKQASLQAQRRVGGGASGQVAGLGSRTRGSFSSGGLTIG